MAENIFISSETHTCLTFFCVSYNDNNHLKFLIVKSD